MENDIVYVYQIKVILQLKSRKQLGRFSYLLELIFVSLKDVSN